MLGKVKTYKKLRLVLSCSSEVKNVFTDLDLKIQEAYKKGYEGMAALDEELIFQWTGRMVYGLWVVVSGNGLRKKSTPETRRRVFAFALFKRTFPIVSFNASIFDRARVFCRKKTLEYCCFSIKIFFRYFQLSR